MITLEQAYERAQHERYLTLVELQNPGLEPFEIHTLIERLQLADHYLRWLTDCMIDENQIH